MKPKAGINFVPKSPYKVVYSVIDSELRDEVG